LGSLEGGILQDLNLPVILVGLRWRETGGKSVQKLFLGERN